MQTEKKINSTRKKIFALIANDIWEVIQKIALVESSTLMVL